MPRGEFGAFLEDAAGLHEAPDEFVGLGVADLGVLELLGLVALEQLLGGVLGDDAHGGRKIGVGIAEDLLLLLPEALRARRQRPQPLGDGRGPGHVMLHHRGDDLVVVLGLVERARLLGVDPAGGAIDGELAPAIEIHDRGVADAPDVLDAVDAGIGRGDGVPGVAGHPHAEPVGFVGDRLHQIGGEELAELDHIVAVPLLRAARRRGPARHCRSRCSRARRASLRSRARPRAPRAPARTAKSADRGSCPYWCRPSGRAPRDRPGWSRSPRRW